MHKLTLSFLIFVMCFALTAKAETETGMEEEEEQGLNNLKQDPLETPVPEDWKWPRAKHTWEFGGLTGMEILDGSVGFPIKVTAAYLVDKDGWIEDINNQIFFETMMGPLFVQGEVAFTYSLQLRWNFFRTASTGFYSIFGVGGLFTGRTLGDKTRMYPRLAVGMLYDIGSDVFLRMEVSQELISIGAVIGL